MIRFAENLNKMITAGLGGALEAPSTEVAVGHCIRYLDSSGAVASFETNIAAPIRSLSISMSPIQDLHGYDRPWPAGGGVNLLYKPQPLTQTINGVTWSINEDGSVTANGTASGNSTFNYIFDSDGVGVELVGNFRYRNFPFVSQTIMTSGVLADKWVSIYPNSVTPISDVNGKIHQLWFQIRDGQTADNITIYPMIYADGASVDAWTPYSNLCPITGRDSVTVWREASYDPSADPALTIPLGQTVYGGTLDVSTGKLTVTHGEIASYDGEALPGEWISDRDVYAAGTTPTIGAQVVYVLDTPQTIDLDPQQITTLIGDNNVWSDAGDVDVTYIYYEETEGY